MSLRPKCVVLCVGTAIQTQTHQNCTHVSHVVPTEQLLVFDIIVALVDRFPGGGSANVNAARWFKIDSVGSVGSGPDMVLCCPIMIIIQTGN